MIFFMPYHGFSQCLWGFPLLIMMGNGCKIGKVCGDEAGAEASLQAGSRQALTPSRQQKKILFGMEASALEGLRASSKLQPKKFVRMRQASVTFRPLCAPQ
jgi:hypothetical protein